MGPLTNRLLPLLLSLALAGCGVARPGLVGPEAATRVGAASHMEDWMDEVFTAADANRDGQLTYAETGLLPEQIDVLDANGDGRINREEWEKKATLGQIVKKLPAFLPLVVSLHGALDADRNRHVSIAEIKEAIATPTPLRGGADWSVAEVEQVFKGADADTDGGLTGDEFERFYLDMSTLNERGFFKRVAMALLGTYVSLASKVAVKQALHPKRLPITETPAKFGLAFENVALRTEDLLTVKGWYVPARIKTDKAVLLLHGRADTRQMFVRQRQIEWLAEHYNVLAIDLRNHGESGGTVTTFGVGETRDAEAALAYLKKRGNTSIGIYGISLGAATAIRTAALHPEIKAVVDDCAYATVVSAFKGFISFMFVPNPVLVAAATLVRANHLLGTDLTAVEPLGQVRAIAPRPFLLIHGEKDQYITVENSRINYHAAGDGLEKELWVVPKAEHAVAAVTAPAEYKQRLLAFFKKAL